MIELKYIITLAFLIILSAIDIKTFNLKKGSIPAVLTTLFLIVTLVFGGTKALYLGAILALIALLLTDLEFWGGIADFKVFIAPGLVMPTLLIALYYALITSIIALIVKGIILKVFKRKDIEIPFIPVSLVAFLITWGLFLI